MGEKKISIIMAYFNRKPQLLFTLKKITESEYKNFEVIIVDDCSNIDNNIDNIEKNYNFKIKLIKINKNEKTWINPCVAYNIGIKNADGEIIILQNPEVCHVGDCIKFVGDNLIKKDWLTLNCYGLRNFNHNEKLYNFNNNIKIYNYIKKIDNDKVGGNAAFREEKNDVGGWLNNFEKHFVAYHYFAAIYKDDLKNKMEDGFHLNYKNGICWDDNDFIKYLIYNKFNFKCTEFLKNKPFVIHQYHDKDLQLSNELFLKNHNINKNIFIERMNKINFNLIIDIHDGFNMPKPILI